MYLIIKCQLVLSQNSIFKTILTIKIGLEGKWQCVLKGQDILIYLIDCLLCV